MIVSVCWLGKGDSSEASGCSPGVGCNGLNVDRLVAFPSEGVYERRGCMLFREVVFDLISLLSRRQESQDSPMLLLVSVFQEGVETYRRTLI